MKTWNRRQVLQGVAGAGTAALWMPPSADALGLPLADVVLYPMPAGGRQTGSCGTTRAGGQSSLSVSH